MADSNHYQTLNVSPNASQAEIKQAYRRLVKQYHPDSNQETVDREDIIRINAAYEVLGDASTRKSYDRQIHYQYHKSYASSYSSRQERTVEVQKKHQTKRRTGKTTDEKIEEWLRLVYHPLNSLLSPILNSLKQQINELSADPFDDQLLEEFQDYLQNCREKIKQAQFTFRSLPNPPSLARTAAHFYYCLNQINDGLNELEYFPLSYDESYLHAGLEMFRIAHHLYREAQQSVQQF
ncbi:J domain-containing protein [Calothrix rhizosoleniae]|uniref:J domain-containing protein n=1 Tax=Calothrix rhizosoleniae TaxID=888997 RepID=UPI000B49D6FB|nr:DnaJ domain-containing protein [Calothrix rhizosoleniae]